MVVNSRDVICVLCDVGSVHVFLKDSIYIPNIIPYPTHRIARYVDKKLYTSAAALI